MSELGMPLTVCRDCAVSIIQNSRSLRCLEVIRYMCKVELIYHIYRL